MSAEQRGKIKMVVEVLRIDQGTPRRRPWLSLVRRVIELLQGGVGPASVMLRRRVIMDGQQVDDQGLRQIAGQELEVVVDLHELPINAPTPVVEAFKKSQLGQEAFAMAQGKLPEAASAIVKKYFDHWALHQVSPTAPQSTPAVAEPPAPPPKVTLDKEVAAILSAPPPSWGDEFGGRGPCQCRSCAGMWRARFVRSLFSGIN